MYRISPPGEEGLTQFGTTALRRGGVFIRTGHAPPVGTPVMVCVVHPVSGDEFPLKGEVVSINATAKKSAGIAVQFVRKGPVVEKEYQYFVALGLPDDNRAIQSQSDVQTDEIARVADNADTDPSQPILAAQEFDEPQASTIDIELTELEIIAELTPKGIHVQPLSSGTSDETADAQQLDSNNDSSGRGGHDR